MPNPSGSNQYKDCPPPDDPKVRECLVEYHRRGITDKKIISNLLLAEHGIKLQPRSVARRRAAFGLYASGKTTIQTPDTVKRQLVLDQLSKDPLSRQGPNTIRENIMNETGIHLKRDYIRDEMRIHDPDGFALRAPTAKKVHREVLVALGPHHEWSADGHDKLTAIGFPIWGVRDKWSGKWLGLWVVPNNRLKLAVAYLYLSLVYKLGGIPIQSTTDCGSETTRMFALANALRELFSDLPLDELPAHKFLRSIHNITIERGWFRLRLQWGDNVKVFYEAGSFIYNPGDPVQFELHEWLWPKLIQQELDSLQDRFNNHPTRFDKTKLLPSGVAPNIAYAMPEAYGGENYLQPVDRNVIQSIMEEIGAECIQFVTPEYARKAEAIFSAIQVTKLTKENVWKVFSMMLPYMYAH